MNGGAAAAAPRNDALDRARQRLVAYAATERAFARDASLLAALSAPPLDQQIEFQAILLRISENIFGADGRVWARSLIATDVRAWANGVLCETLGSASGTLSRPPPRPNHLTRERR